MRLKGTRKAYCYRMKEIKHSFEDEETISGTKTCKHVRKPVKKIKKYGKFHTYGRSALFLDSIGSLDFTL